MLKLLQTLFLWMALGFLVTMATILTFEAFVKTP
jgi:hypothetical protein